MDAEHEILLIRIKKYEETIRENEVKIAKLSEKILMSDQTVEIFEIIKRRKENSDVNINLYLKSTCEIIFNCFQLLKEKKPLPELVLLHYAKQIEILR